MATTSIKVKRSAVAGRIPTTADLQLGEIAINTYDGVAYIKKNVNGTETVVNLGGTVELSQNLQNRYQYTATSNQTTFAAVYLAPFVDVFLNGVKLVAGVDYTATNGTSIVLTAGATAGNILDIVAYTTYTANANYADFDNAIVVNALGYTPYNATNPSNYITLAQARSGISASGSLSYNSSTGVISYTTPSTSGISEGTNLYFTDARARSALSAGTGISYNSSTGAISSTITQYTDALARAAISVTGSGSYDSATGVITVTGGVTSVNTRTGAVTLTSSDVGLGSVENKSSATIRSELTSGNVTGALGFTPENSANRGVANGYASLNSSGQIPSTQLPSYVDDVIEAANLASFPATGETGKIYVALDTNKTYRWSGSAYVYITSGAVDSVAGKTGVVTLTNSDVGLGSVENKSSATIRGELTSSNVTTALGFTPYNSSNPSGYITGITSGMVTTALGFTPYNNSNPSGYITSSALSGYLTSASAASTYVALAGSYANPSWITSLDASKLTGTLDNARVNGGTYSINISGTAATATSAPNYLPLSGGTLTGDLITRGIRVPHNDYELSLGYNGTGNGVGVYFNSPADGVYFYNRTGGANLVFIGRSGGLNVITGALTQAGNQVLHAGNYNSYSPTLTGGGASGTWNINITGSAATATDSTKLPLAGGTMTGAITFAAGQTWPTFNQNTTGNAATVTSITSSQVTTALGFTPYNATNPSGYITGITSSNVTTALGFTPYNATNPSGYITSSALSNYLPLTASGIQYLRFDTASTEHITFQNQTSGGAIQLGFQQNDTDGLHHRAYFKFYKGSAGSVAGAMDIIMRSVGGATTTDIFRLQAGSVPTWAGSTMLTASNYNSYSPTLTGGGASGTWGISITGLAGGLSDTSNYMVGRGSYSAGNVDSITGLGVWNQNNVGDSHTVLVFGQGGSTSTVQQRFLYTGSMEFRNRTDSVNWTPFKTVLTSANYNSYSPTLTGGGASGTWGINITGNAATATSATDSTKLPLTGGTLSGPLVISTGATNNNYNEGLRITRANNSWAGITFGSTGSSGAPTGGWFVATNPSAQFIISPDDSSNTTGLTLNKASNALWTNNVLLHAGNYSSYALPLTGGTLTGKLKISLAGGTLPANFFEISNTVAGAGNRAGMQLNTGSSWSTTIFTEQGNWWHAFGSDVGDVRWGYDGTNLKVGSNIVFHAGNYTSYVNPKGGGWYGSGLPGSRWGGYAVSNGEISFGDGLPNAGQMGILVDGCYVAGENNGFWSMGSDNTWGSRRGMYWDGTYLNFTTNSATASFSNALIGGNQVLHANNVSSYAHTISTNPSNSGPGTLAIGNNGSYSFVQSHAGQALNLNPVGNAVNIAGNTAIHAGNYGSYALPLTGGSLSGNLMISPVTSSWAEGLSFTMPTTSRWGGLRWRRERGNNDGNWYIGFTALDSSDDLVFGANNGGNQIDNILRMTKAGAVTSNGHQILHAGNINSYIPSWSTSATGNTIAYRDGVGDIAAREIVLTVGVQDFTPSSLVAIYPTTNQAVKVTAGGARNFLDVPTRGGGNASGTWGISINGNASSALQVSTDTGSKGNALQYWQAYDRADINPNSNWHYAIRMSHGDADTYYSATLALDFHDDAFQFRRKVNGSNQSWRTLIHNGNFGSYALPLSGGTLTGNLTMSGAGNSNSIIFGDATKRINVEGYWMMFKGHENEGFRWQTAGQDGATYTTRMQLTSSALTVTGGLAFGGSTTFLITTGIWAGSGGYPGYQFTGGNNRFGFSSTSGYIDVYTDGNFYAGIDLNGSNNLVLHAGNFGSYAINRGGDTVGGVIQFQMNRNGRSGNTDTAGLQAYSTGNNSAYMSFHKGGHYAVNMGLDDDNVMRIGGWSAAANRWQLDMSGNGTYAGNVTAYSDERLKKDWAAIPSGFVERLAQIKSGTYTRIDSGERQAGSSAQDWQALLPEVVTASNDEAQTLSLAYGNAALVSAVELAKEIVNLKAQINQQQLELDELKSLVKSLLASR